MRSVISYCLFFMVLGLLLLPNAVDGQEDKGVEKQTDSSALIRGATERLRKKQKYELRYKIPEGSRFRWSVEHTATTRTKISNSANETASRSNSVKVWDIKSVDSKGNMTLVHSIESVRMWQKNGDQDPVEFDSTDSNAKTPPEYESVSDKIGSPLATITINSQGQVLDRKSKLPNASFGAGDITIPLPKEEVPIGFEWYVPKTLNAKEETGKRVYLKSRIHYKLANVKGDSAFISFRTEVLTPIESDKVRSQIMQQMTEGYLVFDMKQGVPVRKEIEWDEKVHGYEGPNSFLSYAGKLKEQLLADNETLKPLPTKTKVSSLKSEKPTKRK